MKKYKKILLFLSIFFILFTSFTKITFAEDAKYYSHLSQEQIEDIFNLKVSDIPDPWAWISKAKTFVIVEDNNNNLTYWWNTPNIQMSAQNSLYDIVSMSGYGNGKGENPERNGLVNLPDRKDAKTALQKYGFNIPSPTYVGERPLITISVSGVLMPDGIFNGIGRVWDFVWKGEVVSAPTSKDMNSLVYVAPRDYETSGITFERWVHDNWYKAMKNIKANQVLVSNGDKNGVTEGKQWIKEYIITNYGLDKPGLNEKEICQKLQENCGKYYPDVAKNIILSSGIGEKHNTERIMPYDLSRMNSKDAEMFKGISDPRSDMQQTLFSTGYDKLLYGLMKSSVLSLSSKISELTISLNGFANFQFLENVGLSPIDIWNNSIMQLLTLLMLCIFVFYVIKSAFKVVRGNYSGFSLITKVFSSFIIVLFVLNLTYNTEKTYDLIKNISSSVFNIANVSFQKNESLEPLYGNGSAQEKEDVELWLPYFNTWTVYHTNHSILDDSQKIKNENLPESKNLIKPEINGVKQNLWCTILADSFTDNKNYSGSIYRVVDHFMAPRIEKFTHSDNNINVSVRQNENFNGNIQSSINIMILPFQILLLFFVVLKVGVFFEFIFNISTLLFNLALSITNKFKLSLTLKELGASMLNICIINTIIGLIVWTSLITSGFGSIILCIFYIFLTVSLIRELARSNSVFTPKFFRPAQKLYYKTKDMFEE